MGAAIRLSASDSALVATVYSPPLAHGSWGLKDVLPNGPTAYYSLGRWALVDALRAFGVGRGDRVLLPGLICREVLASVHFLGATPAFYPVTRQLSADLSDRSIDGTKAVVAVNYFGFPRRLEPFRDFCTRTGAALIEDNAHGLFSRDEHGSLLGARGDAGIFSFRKTIAVPDGAALVVNGSGEMPPAPPVKASGTPPARYRVKQAFRRVAGPFGAVGALDAIRAVRGARRVFTGHAIPSGAADAETSIPVGPEPTTAIMRPITVADPELETQRRRALYDVAARVLSKTSAIPVFPSLPRYVVPYGFPIFVDPSDAPRVAATIGRYGFQLAGWPDLPSAVAAEAPEHYHHLMVLPFLW